MSKPKVDTEVTTINGSEFGGKMESHLGLQLKNMHHFLVKLRTVKFSEDGTALDIWNNVALGLAQEIHLEFYDTCAFDTPFVGLSSGEVKELVTILGELFLDAKAFKSCLKPRDKPKCKGKAGQSEKSSETSKKPDLGKNGAQKPSGTDELRFLFEVLEIIRKYLGNKTWRWKPKVDDELKMAVLCFVQIFHENFKMYDELKAVVSALTMAHFGQPSSQPSLNKMREKYGDMAREKLRAIQSPRARVTTGGVGITKILREVTEIMFETVDEVSSSEFDSISDSGKNSEEENETGNTMTYELIEEQIDDGDEVILEMRKRQLTPDDYMIVRYGLESIQSSRGPRFFEVSCKNGECPARPFHYSDGKQFKCACGHKFCEEKYLELQAKELLEEEVGEVILKCEKCNFKSHRRCCMNKHLQERHKVEEIPMQKSNRRLYECQWGCEQLFLTKRQLILHNIETARECKIANAKPIPNRKTCLTPDSELALDKLENLSLGITNRLKEAQLERLRSVKSS